MRRQAGIGFTGGEYAESFALADVRLDSEAPEDEVILFYARTGLTVVAPLPHGIHRIVAPLEHAPEEPTAPFVQELLDTRAFGNASSGWVGTPSLRTTSTSSGALRASATS